MEEKSKGKKILEILQENYEIESAQDLSSAIKDLFKDSLQEMMNAEFETSMGYQKYDNKTEKTNYRNGKIKKKLKCENAFEPKIVPENKRDVSGIEDKIISLYGRGLSTREINEQIQDLYGIEISSTMVSNVTDQIIPKIKKWQDRALESSRYPICFVDAVHFSERDESSVVKKAAYIVLGINEYGEKDVLGIWIGENESAKFWLSVFKDLKSRGVKDILILCSDGLTGMKEAITTAFTKTEQQRCIVHMIRNSVRFISYKELKPFCEDLKTIYTSKNEKAGYEQLQKIKEKWKNKYPTALKSWEENWDAICPFFSYSEPVRKIMYTTNTIERLNHSYRKYTKTKSVFLSDEALMKCLYLATLNITKKWNGRYRNWDLILGELSIMFEGRI